MLIEQASVETSGKFLAITGESGSGKSSIMEALKLALGCKSSSDLIRRGQESGQVCATFDLSNLEPLTQKRLQPILEEQGIRWDPSEALVVQRQIFANKASKALVSGQSVPQNFLQKLGLELVEIVDAGASFTLEQLETHLECLDAFAGNEELKDSCQRLWNEKQNIQEELNLLRQQAGQKENLISLLEHQIEEIRLGIWKEEEEEQLLQESQRISRFDQTLELLTQLSQELANPVFQKLPRLLSSLDRACGYDSRLLTLSECLRGCLVQAQEAQNLIEPLVNDESLDPEMVKRLEKRLEEIHRLKKKYGNDPKSLEIHLQQAQEKLADIRNLEERQQALETQNELLEKQLLEVCQKLSHKRRESCPSLEEQVQRVLQDLNMPHASFSVEITPRGIGPSGTESIEFFLCPNPGEPKRSVRKFASGGEMARLFMALKTLKAHRRIPPTLIFDEIDSNIGGESAVKLAHKFKEMSQSRQVICITHFAQVAREADCHLVTEKRVENERTLAKIRHLKAPKERESELSRMMGHTLKGRSIS